MLTCGANKCCISGCATGLKVHILTVGQTTVLTNIFVFVLVFVHDVFVTLPTPLGAAGAGVQVFLQLVEGHFKLTDLTLHCPLVAFLGLHVNRRNDYTFSTNTKRGHWATAMSGCFRMLSLRDIHTTKCRLSCMRSLPVLAIFNLG